MTLQAKLNEIKQQSIAKFPPEILEVILAANKALEESTIMTKVLKKGDKAPNFTLKDELGQDVELSQLCAKGTVILSFYRGVWWPYCNAELEALQEVHGDIVDAGAQLVAISPQLSKYSKQVVSKNKLTYPVLSDENNNVAEQFGIVFTLPKALQEVYSNFGIDLVRFNGNDHWTLPLAGHFIIDTNGIIQDVAVSHDYTQRPEPKELMTILSHI